MNGNIAALAGAMTLSASGGGTATIAITGTSTQTFTDQLGTYWQLPQLLINTPNKTALLGYGNFLLGSTTIQTGELWIPSSTVSTSTSLNLNGNITIASAGALRIFQPSSTIANAAASNVTITNNGFVEIDAPWGGCNQSSSVALSGGASNKIIWAGSGKNLIRYVTASYQSSAVPITTINSLDGSPGNTNTNFVFPALPSPVQLIQQTNVDCIYICHSESASTQWGVRPGDTVIVSLANDGLTSPVITDNASNTYKLITSSTVVTTQTVSRSR